MSFAIRDWHISSSVLYIGPYIGIVSVKIKNKMNFPLKISDTFTTFVNNSPHLPLYKYQGEVGSEQYIYIRLKGTVV